MSLVSLLSSQNSFKAGCKYSHFSISNSIQGIKLGQASDFWIILGKKIKFQKRKSQEKTIILLVFYVFEPYNGW